MCIRDSYLAWISLIGTATSNSVNVADGLDGLAAGSGVFVVGAYSLMAFWQNKQMCADVLDPSVQAGCYAVRDPFDLAIVGAAFVGALVGFLWWNAPKARVFMGDCGSMAIGGVIAAMAILTRTELLLILIAGPYRSGTGGDPALIARNLERLEEAAAPIHRLGHVPMIGEWAALPILRGMDETDAAEGDVMYETAHRLLQHCDAVLRLPGDSAGADKDVEIALERGLPVYRSLDEIPAREIAAA